MIHCERNKMQTKGRIETEASQSIIIAFHKNTDLLTYCLKTVLDTTPDNVEIIIVANSSNPNDIEVSFENKRIKILKYEENLLYSKAMNLGVSHASGEIITLLDQDVFCIKNWYALLLQKLYSSERIAAVSPKLINPTNDHIIDFGIAYSPQNIVHPLRGMRLDHEMACSDRKVSSACSAVMMTYKSIYEYVGGMDIDMPYICSDCDYGIQLMKNGFETWVVADALVYHKGSSSNLNTKVSEFNYLREDSKAMFFAKNYRLIPHDIKDYMSLAGNHFKKNNSINKRYFLYNLSSFLDADFYISAIPDILEIELYDVYSFNPGGRNIKQLQIYDYIPMSHLDIDIPFIYFVDLIDSLECNKLWWQLRRNKNDIIIDTNGNFSRAGRF